MNRGGDSSAPEQQSARLRRIRWGHDLHRRSVGQGGFLAALADFRNIGCLGCAGATYDVSRQSSSIRAARGPMRGSPSVAFSGSGFGDLVAATGAVDQTGTYVFEVPVSSAAQNWAKESAFWTTANGSDTMLTLWNSGTSAEDLIATFTWNGMAGEYKLPVHLGGASMVIDMAQLIALNKPDLVRLTLTTPSGSRGADGKVIPADVREGTASGESGCRTRGGATSWHSGPGRCGGSTVRL